MRGSAFLCCAALLVGAAVGYCIRPGGDQGARPDPERRPSHEKHPPADVGESASLKALRARVAELERQLAASMAAQQADTGAVAVAVAPAPGNGQMRGHREWMENLKKNDPEKYAQMTNRFAQFRRSRQERQQRNLDFLSSVDTSRMSASAKKTHAALQSAIARREELEDLLHREDLSDDERRAAWESVRESDRELRRLRRAERSNLFEATAKTLGFGGEDAKEIVATLEEVVDATDSSWRHHGPPSGGRPGGGR